MCGGVPGVSVSPSTWWYQSHCLVLKHNMQGTAKLRQFLPQVTPLETWRNVHWAGCVSEGVSTTLLLLLLVPMTNSEQSAHVRCSYQLLMAFGVNRSPFLTAVFHAWISSQSSGGVGPDGRNIAFFSHPCFLGFQGLGKAEVLSLKSLVQSFANGSFLIFIGVWLNCHELCMYRF